jgi:hypothetical protein
MRWEIVVVSVQFNAAVDRFYPDDLAQELHVSRQADRQVISYCKVENRDTFVLVNCPCCVESYFFSWTAQSGVFFFFFFFFFFYLSFFCCPAMKQGGSQLQEGGKAGAAASNCHDREGTENEEEFRLSLLPFCLNFGQKAEQDRRRGQLNGK